MTPKLLLKFSLVLLFSSMFFVPLSGQTQEQAKAQAEGKLRTMTPEQIDKKIKELGLTKEEAIQRAKGYGIGLEQFLQKAPDSEQWTVPEETEGKKEEGDVSKPVLPPKVELPGFVGRTGMEVVAPFGYDIFQASGTTFETSPNVPPPPSYVLGPGDEVIITVWGETQLYYRISVTKEGAITIPDVGQVLVSGMTLEKTYQALVKRMTRIYSGLKEGAPSANTYLDISIGKLRSIQVYVLGEVNKPGGYQLSSMATAFTALYRAGGPTLSGSLRNVRVIRSQPKTDVLNESSTTLRADRPVGSPRAQPQAKSASVIDVYEYAIKGDKSKDVRLEDGDIVLVKPVGRRVALLGRVLRPAIYELKEKEKLGDLVGLAGGIGFDAYTDRIHIERVIPFEERTQYRNNILDIDVRFENVQKLLASPLDIEDGDVVTILTVNQLRENLVTIYGNVKKPGRFQLREGMRVRDLIVEADSLLTDTFGEKAVILRALANSRTEVITFNLDRAMAGDPANNLELQTLDEVTIYSQQYFFPQRSVEISGAVRTPGIYSRSEGLTVSKLMILAGGITWDASVDSIEVTRIDTTTERAVSRTFEVSLPRDYWRVDSLHDVVLQDLDHVTIKLSPKYSLPKLVEIRGEVRYPGKYAIRTPGERLSSFISRAGGLKPTAYFGGSRLIRAADTAGLVPIDFKIALSDTTSPNNIEMLKGDVVVIAFIRNVVQVKGEVVVPSAALYRKGESLNYYLAQAGGTTDAADLDRIVVTLPNGRRWVPGWFIFPGEEILSGSLVYVPKKVEKEDKTLQILTSWATVMASLAAITIGIIQVTK
jgi:protein involved in polysaccharide export with SLBB domain